MIDRDKLGVLTKVGQGGQGVVYRAPKVRTRFAPWMVFKEYKASVPRSTSPEHVGPGLQETTSAASSRVISKPLIGWGSAANREATPLRIH
jgi:hypothetical protein